MDKSFVIKYNELSKDKTIILDIDGVVLRWSSMIIPFLLSEKKEITTGIRNSVLHGVYLELDVLDQYFPNGFLHEYHKSTFATEMAPMESDLLFNLALLKKKFNIIALTSFSDHPDAINNRKINLEKYFPEIFDELRILPALHEKETSLKELDKILNISYFIDDSKKHIEEGIRVLGEDRVIHFEYLKWENIRNLLLANS